MKIKNSHFRNIQPFQNKRRMTMKILALLLILVYSISDLSATNQQYQVIDLGFLNEDASQCSNLNNNNQVLIDLPNKNKTLLWDEQQGAEEFSSLDRLSFLSNYIEEILNEYSLPTKIEATIYSLNNLGNVAGKIKGEERPIFLIQDDVLSRFPIPQEMNEPVSIVNLTDNGDLLLASPSEWVDVDTVLDPAKTRQPQNLWLLRNGSYEQIEHPQLNQAKKLNNRSEILGQSFQSQGQETKVVTVVYNIESQSIRQLKFPYSTFATDINDRGDVIGVYEDETGKRHSFLWDQDGTVIPLSGIQALSINNHQEILGFEEWKVEERSKSSWYYHDWSLGHFSLTVHPVRSEFYSASPSHPWILWKKGEFLYVEEPTALSKFSSLSLSKVNDHGWIQGNGMIDESARGFLLKPL